MYCHNCGKEVYGNFCSNCRAKVLEEGLSKSKIDWTVEKNFDKLIKNPRVREIILKYANESLKKISAQEFLELADTIFESLIGVSTKKVSDLVVPIYQKLGISTGKAERKNFNQPIQQVIVKSLCSLAKNGFPVESYEGASDGLLVTAKIPSDMWTWGGDIIISIEGNNSSSEINIVVKIKGQLYDWGKSKKLINSFLLDMQNIELHT